MQTSTVLTCVSILHIILTHIDMLQTHTYNIHVCHVQNHKYLWMHKCSTCHSSIWQGHLWAQPRQPLGQSTTALIKSKFPWTAPFASHGCRGAGLLFVLPVPGPFPCCPLFWILLSPPLQVLAVIRLVPAIWSLVPSLPPPMSSAHGTVSHHSSFLSCFRPLRPLPLSEVRQMGTHKSILPTA